MENIKHFVFDLTCDVTGDLDVKFLNFIWKILSRPFHFRLNFSPTSVGFRDRWGAATAPHPPAKGRGRTRPSRARGRTRKSRLLYHSTLFYLKNKISLRSGQKRQGQFDLDIFLPDLELIVWTLGRGESGEAAFERSPQDASEATKWT